MRRFVMAIALTSLFSVTALAGSIPTGDAPAPGNTQGPTITVILTLLSIVI